MGAKWFPSASLPALLSVEHEPDPHGPQELGIQKEELGIQKQELGIQKQELGIQKQELGIQKQELGLLSLLGAGGARTQLLTGALMSYCYARNFPEQSFCSNEPVKAGTTIHVGLLPIS